jgi:Zn-dependent oligopeptidase
LFWWLLACSFLRAQAFRLVLSDPSDVAGLPPSALALAAQTYNTAKSKEAAAAAATTEAGDNAGCTDASSSSSCAAADAAATPEATAEAGPWQLGLDMPSYLPAQKFIKSRKVWLDEVVGYVLHVRTA